MLSIADLHADGLPEMVDATKFLSTKIETPPELIKGIIHQGSKLAVGGGSKTFKSWLLLDMAVSIAAKQPWLELPTSGGKVLFVNLELQDFCIQDRIALICKAREIDLEPGKLVLWNLRGFAANYTDLLPKIESRMRQENFAQATIDPIYKISFNTVENSAEEVSKLLNAVERVTVSTGAACAFAAHFTKGNASNKEPIDRISGSGVYARDPDTILTLTRHEVSGAFTVDVVLRNFAPMEPFVIRWEVPLMRRDHSLDPTKLKKAGRPRKYGPEMLLNRLGEGLESEAWFDLVHKETRMSRSKFYELHRELEHGNRIRCNGSLRWEAVQHSHPKSVQ